MEDNEGEARAGVAGGDGEYNELSSSEFNNCLVPEALLVAPVPALLDVGLFVSPTSIEDVGLVLEDVGATTDLGGFAELKYRPPPGFEKKE